MALSNDTLAWIAELAGVKAEDITAKLNSEKEETIEKPNGSFFTETELKERDSNKYNEAKVAFEEMTVKNLKKKHGYDLEGKNFDDFFKHHDNALKTKYQKDTSERVKELEQDLEKAVKFGESQAEELQTKLAGLESSYMMEAVKNDLLSIMPNETSIPKDDVMTLFLSKHKIGKDENGNKFISKGDTVMKDERTGSYLDYKNIFSDFTESYKAKSPGRGGGNEPGGGNASSEDQFIEKWTKENGKPISSPEGVQALIKYQSDK